MNYNLNYIQTTHNNPVEKGYHWVESWLFSTNAKQIGILYGIYALFSGVVGLSLSILMRIELASPNPQILLGNGQLWNVVITAHALFMVFFLVMPVTMGAFGKINNNINLYKNHYELGSYLAGLIEGKGSIIIHNNISKNRYSPMISIILSESLIKYLQLNIELYYNIKIGTIHELKSNKLNKLWQINKIEDIYIILSLTNGYYRTPKIIKIYEAINWINLYIHNNNNMNKIKDIDFIEIKSIDESLLSSNNWLNGFTESNGSFNIKLNTRRNKNKFIELQFKIKIQHINENNIVNINIINKDKIYESININLSYYPIMIKIASFFNSSLNSYNSNKYETHTIIVNKLENQLLVKEYYSNHKLLSSKYHDFNNWIKILNCIYLHKSKSHNDCINLFKNIYK